MTDTKFITLLVKKVSEQLAMEDMTRQALQVSERFTAVDMDLSEDSVDLEEATVNGIQLLSVSIHLCFSNVEALNNELFRASYCIIILLLQRLSFIEFVLYLEVECILSFV